MFNNNPVITCLIVSLLIFWFLMRKKPLVAFYFGLFFYLLCTAFFFFINDWVTGLIFIFIIGAYVETSRRTNDLNATRKNLKAFIRKEVRSMLLNDVNLSVKNCDSSSSEYDIPIGDTSYVPQKNKNNKIVDVIRFIFKK